MQNSVTVDVFLLFLVLVKRFRIDPRNTVWQRPTFDRVVAFLR